MALARVHAPFSSPCYEPALPMTTFVPSCSRPLLYAPLCVQLKADEVDQRLRRRLFTKADEAAPGEDPMGLMFADEMVLSEKLENLTRPPGHPLGGKKSIHNAIMFQAVADEYQVRREEGGGGRGLV